MREKVFKRVIYHPLFLMAKIQKSNRIGARPYQQYVRTALGAYKLARGAFRAYKGWKYTALSKNKNRGKDTGGVTFQNDVRVQYRNRRMPRFKRKRWSRFKKKIRAVNISEAGNKTVVFNDAVTLATTSGKQNFVGVCLYGINGSADSSVNAGYRDMVRIMNNDPDFLQQGAAPGNKAIMGKYHGKSAVLDVTFTNINDPETPLISTMELDIYEIKHFGDPMSKLTVPIEFAEAALITPTISGGSSAIDLTSRGVTPFEMTEALSNGRMKIVKKTKYFLSSGQYGTYQYRDPGNRILTAEFVNDAGYGKKWLTTTLLFVFKPMVGAPTQVALALGVTRKYSYTTLFPVFDKAEELV